MPEQASFNWIQPVNKHKATPMRALFKIEKVFDAERKITNKMAKSVIIFFYVGIFGKVKTEFVKSRLLECAIFWISLKFPVNKTRFPGFINFLEKNL